MCACVCVCTYKIPKHTCDFQGIGQSAESLYESYDTERIIERDPKAQLDARSVALHFNDRFAAQLDARSVALHFSVPH